MNDELRFFLEKGPTTVKELARLTGKSVSALYKALKHEDVITHDTKPTTFSCKPAENGAAVAPAPASIPAEAQAEKAAPAAPAKAKRGRKMTAAGKKLFRVTKSDEDEPINPRRKKSHGFKSLQIIIDNPGITTEEYVTKGGRLNDLAWDIKHGNVRAE